MQKKTAKGVKSSVLKTLHHDTYVQALKNEIFLKNSQTQIISKNHDVSTCVVNKTSLSSFDDKYYRDANGLCLAHGHYQLRTYDTDESD